MYFFLPSWHIVFFPSWYIYIYIYIYIFFLFSLYYFLYYDYYLGFGLRLWAWHCYFFILQIKNLIVCQKWEITPNTDVSSPATDLMLDYWIDSGEISFDPAISFGRKFYNLYWKWKLSNFTMEIVKINFVL